VVCVAVCLLGGACDGQGHTPAGITTVGTGTTSNLASVCPGWVGCQADAACRSCLGAVAQYAAAATSATRTVSNELEFFQTLVHTPACATASALSLTLLAQALQELLPYNPVFVDTCGAAAGLTISYCPTIELHCFMQNSSCRECLEAVITRGDVDGGTAAVLRSPSCRAVPETTAELLAYGESPTLTCFFFPTCSYAKLKCSENATCSACWTTLIGGDAALAAQQCAVGPAAYLLDRLVTNCVQSNLLSCDFWRQRCFDDTDCSQCFAALDEGRSVPALVSGALSADCADAHTIRSAYEPLGNFFASCPSEIVNECLGETFFCVFFNFPLCADCLSNVTLEATPTCQAVLNESGFGVTSSCRECSAEIHLINTIVLATAIVGGISAGACLAVVAFMLIRGLHRESMRDRIVMGLMLANAVFSTANAIPVGRLKSNFVNCGQVALTFDEIRFGRAWWFGGSYALVCFEGFILVVSIRALSRGVQAVPFRTEMMAHILCVLGGLAAFGVFYIRCAEINAAGYNSVAQSETVSNARNFVSRDDDIDDKAPSESAGHRFAAEQGQYNQLEQHMLQAWLGLLGVAIALWLVLRWSHRRMLAAWATVNAESKTAEMADEWAATRRSKWHALRRELAMQRKAHIEVSRPLEPYVLIFVVFGVPAAVMASNFCRDDSHATTDAASDRGSNGSIT
jgi:hypothetical protein